MAIYGVGSNWSGEELKDRFFAEGKFILGWNEVSAKDLYAFVASLKVGDILYIKANSPGSRTIRVKGVGIVTKNLLTCMNSEELANSALSDWESLFVEVAWVHHDEFQINIPENEGKLTNIRAATIYEEYLPYVQQVILEKFIQPASSLKAHAIAEYATVKAGPTKTLQLLFEDDEVQIRAVFLSEYLALFRMVYQAVELEERNDEFHDNEPEKYRMIWEKLSPNILIESLNRYNHRRYWPLYSFFESMAPDDIETETLQISAISKNSPLTISLCGIGIALTVAVIVSGGSIDFSLPGGRVKCSLPPLGKGIEALRKALRKKL